MTKSFSQTHLNNTHASTNLIPAFFLVVLPSHKHTPTAACLSRVIQASPYCT